MLDSDGHHGSFEMNNLLNQPRGKKSAKNLPRQRPKSSMANVGGERENMHKSNAKRNMG
jgi:hypothetical protein